jgi:hypothetical protein
MLIAPGLDSGTSVQYCLVFRYLIIGAYLSCHVGAQFAEEMDDADFTPAEWAAAQFRATLAASGSGPGITASTAVKRRRVPFNKSEVGYKLPRALEKSKTMVRAMTSHVMRLREVVAARPRDFEFILETERAYSVFDEMLGQVGDCAPGVSGSRLSIADAVDEHGQGGLPALLSAVDAGYSAFREEVVQVLDAGPLRPTGRHGQGLKRKGIALKIRGKKAGRGADKPIKQE